MYLALAAFVIACVMNVALRIMTIDQLSPDVSSVSYFGSAAQDSQTSNVDSSAMALTIFSIVIPFVTSLGSFFISYLTYNPLKIAARNQEIMIGEKEDELRRLDAMLSEFENDAEFAENLINDDKQKFAEFKKLERALITNYCNYVRLRLMEHLADPSATSALSEETCAAILQLLDDQLAAFDFDAADEADPSDTDIPDPAEHDTESKSKNTITAAQEVAAA